MTLGPPAGRLVLPLRLLGSEMIKEVSDGLMSFTPTDPVGIVGLLEVKKL